jgi:peptidoglycan-associated lipoprotein
MKRTLLISAALLLFLPAGCAKRPAMTTAAAPAPTGAGGGTSTTPAVAPAAVTSSAPAAPSSARPAPREFTAIPDLSDIHFDFDKYDIRPGDAKLLDANAAWLRNHADHLVLIEGHCDERGTSEYNMALGERRARAASNYLVAHGVAARRITIVSYGEERPLCTEHDEACWAKNRRAHFLVKPE